MSSSTRMTTGRSTRNNFLQCMIDGPQGTDEQKAYAKILKLSTGNSIRKLA